MLGEAEAPYLSAGHPGATAPDSTCTSLSSRAPRSSQPPAPTGGCELLWTRLEGNHHPYSSMTRPDAGGTETNTILPPPSELRLPCKCVCPTDRLELTGAVREVWELERREWSGLPENNYCPLSTYHVLSTLPVSFPLSPKPHEVGTGIPHFSKVHFMPVTFTKDLTLAPVFANRKKSEDNFHF